ERSEKFLRIPVDFQGSEKSHVEVAGGEPERAALVLAHDFYDIGRAELLFGATHTAGPMVVRREGERPGAEHEVVLLQKARCSLRRAIRIQPLVDHSVDAQETTPCAAHELPHACSADLRISIRIE